MLATIATTAYGQYQQGKVANEVGKYNQAAAYREAEMLDQQAGQEVAAGSINSERIARRAEEILANNRASAAAGGQSTTDGSVVAVQNEIVKNASLDQLLEMYEAEDRAKQIKYQGAVTRQQGDYDRWQGRVAQSAANLRTTTTLLQGFQEAGEWFTKFGGG